MMCFVIAYTCVDIGIATRNPMSSGLRIATQFKLPLSIHDGDGIFISSHARILGWKYYYHIETELTP